MGDISNELKEFITLLESGLGISVTPEQEKILQTRINQLCRQYAVDSYEGLYHILVNNPPKRLWHEFLEGIVFRPVSFFADNQHLEFLVDHTQSILEENKRIRQNGEVRIWNIGCSTGEEPYSLAIVLKECLPRTIQAKILATDIHMGSLISASSGFFSPEIKAEISPYLLDKYFRPLLKGYKIKREIKRLVTFRL
jgi:chemotaxis protein methyltransferase CheR